MPENEYMVDTTITAHQASQDLKNILRKRQMRKNKVFM